MFQKSFKNFATIIGFLSFVGSGFSQTLIKVDGSSTVFPVTEAVAEEYQKSTKGEHKVTVGISGTGGGFKKFCRGETDLQNASRPISEIEMAACKSAGITYLEFPVAFDALTIVVNPKNTWVKEISVDDLKKIWAPESQGKITRWNQVRAEWPDAPINLFGAGADSGTFDYFTEAINGKAKSSRGDYTASEDDNTLVTGVARDVNSLGFLPYSYFAMNKTKLKVLSVIGGPKAPKKVAVEPNPANVENGSYFPLSRPLFVYVSTKSLSRAEVKSFTEFYLNNVAELAKAVKYVALPKAAYKKNLEHLKKNKQGTVFGGKEAVGIKIEELMKREATL